MGTGIGVGYRYRRELGGAAKRAAPAAQKFYQGARAEGVGPLRGLRERAERGERVSRRELSRAVKYTLAGIAATALAAPVGAGISMALFGRRTWAAGAGLAAALATGGVNAAEFLRRNRAAARAKAGTGGRTAG